MTEGNSELRKESVVRSLALPPHLLQTQIFQYSVAVLSVGLALAINWLLHPYLEPTPTPPFFAAVMVSAWYGGLGPGICATVLSTLAINYFLIEPIYAFGLPDLGTIVRLGVFVMAALLINSLNESQRVARRRAESSLRSLRESEARFGCLAESNTIGMIVADLDGTVLEANDIFLQMVGCTQEELRSGRVNWRELTPPESLEASERAVQELVTTGACTPFEKEYLHKEGSRVPVLHGAVMTGPATVTGFVVNLSERKQAEAAQQEAFRREQALHAEVQTANAQLERVLASLNDQFLALDRDWRYVYVSDRVVEVVGRPREDLLGRCIWEVFPDTVDSAFYRTVHQAVAEQQVMQFEYFYPSWQRWFENRVYPSAAGVSVLVTDITDRKRAEDSLQRTNQMLETLLDVCPVAIAFLDPQGIVRRWNRAAERIYGWSAEEAIGQFMPAIPYGQEEFLTSLEAVLAGRSLDGVEAQHPRKNGSRVDLEIWATPAFDAEGNPGCLGIAWDITERKQAEEALRESQARFQVLVSNMPGMVYRYAPTADGGGAFTYVSSGSRELVELEPETLLQDANAFLALIHPDDLLSFQESIAAAVANSIAWRWEGRVTTPSGQLKWIQGRSRPQQMGYGEAWDGFFFDVTERKQAEAALRQSEEWYRAIYNQVLIGISQTDLTGTFISANERFCEIVGRSLEELLTLKMQDITHPDDLPDNVVLFQQMVREGGSFEIEKRYVRPDGSDVWVRNYVSLLRDGAGNPKCGTAVTQDITERKRAEADLRDSEERLRLALIAANQGLYDLNVQTGEAIVTPAYAEMLGYDPAEFQETNARWRDRLHPDDVPVVYQAYEDYVAGKLDSYQVEFRQRTKSGDWKWLLSIGRIVAWDQDGQPLRMLGTHTDITDRKQAETEREQLLMREKAAREEAETANRIKDEFLAVLSHELRSPLNPILGWSRLLQTRKLDEQVVQQALATIERNARLQTQLIEDLLDVSRILRGKLVLNTGSVNLVSTIESALETVRLAVEAKGIRIQKTFAPGVAPVIGDATRLQQVIWNLLTNAVKFTPSEGAIEIGLAQTNGTAEIWVKDTGKGITPDFLPYVFDYFRQEDGTTTRKFGGLGLGLAIVRHITELHGGTVRAASAGEGLGATFTVRLPLWRSGSGTTGEPEATPTSADSPLPLLTGLRILAVDDDADIRDLIHFILQQAGAEVQVVSSAAEALQQFAAFSPQILISDVGMPGTDGYMLIQQIRSLPSELGSIPAIALTAYAGEIDRQQAIAAGFQSHLTKPIEPERLIHAITNVLRKDSPNFLDS